MTCTYQYYLADTDEERAVYSQLADDFRNSGYTTTPYESWNNIISGMKSKPTNNTVSKWEHYYRNNLNIEFDYGTLYKLNNRLPDDLKWHEEELATYHQHHKVENKPNKKYVSACGHFEIVYNAYNEIQNIYNNPDDMGTYNYYSPSDWTLHTIYDIVPYSLYNNVPN